MKKTLKMIALLIMIVAFATGCSFNKSASAPKTTADGKVIIEPGSKDDPLNGAEIIMLTIFRGYARLSCVLRRGHDGGSARECEGRREVSESW